MTTIMIMAMALGGIVPLLLILVLYKGIGRSPFAEQKKSRFKNILLTATAA